MRVLLGLLLILLASPGCVWKVGSNLTAGVLDEAAGEARTGGLPGVGERLLEREILGRLGHQFGAGIASGATEITPEQRASLEEAVDAVLTLAAVRAGEGVRHELSPAVRDLIREDIVNTLTQAMRGELGSTLEETVDRLVTQAVRSLHRGMEEPDLKVAFAELLRDGVYLSMREGRPGVPGVGETLETTFTRHLLVPFEHSVGSVADTVAATVEEQARRTENTLRGIIVVLAVVVGVLMLMYLVARRQLVRERIHVQEAEQGLRSLDAALGMLDENTRSQILGKYAEYRAVVEARQAPAPPKRSAAYEREDP